MPLRQRRRLIFRPLLRWHGGKFVLAPKIVDLFPPHRKYTEIYGGAASVLLYKDRCYSEVYNDLDQGVVNLMQVLRDGKADELVRRLRLTPFARREFDLSYRPSKVKLESARRLIVRSFMGFGSDGHNVDVVTGFRADSDKSGTTPAHDWANYPEVLSYIADRIAGVVIESRPALKVLADHDRDDALHYVDPPYLPSTRSDKSRKGGGKYHAYAHEMSEACHVEMLTALLNVSGMVALSAYPSELYADMLHPAGWECVEFSAHADGARDRTEQVWLNPQLLERRSVARQLHLPIGEESESRGLVRDEMAQAANEGLEAAGAVPLRPGIREDVHRKSARLG